MSTAAPIVANSESLGARLERYYASDPAYFADPVPLFHDVREAGPVYDYGPFVIVAQHAAVKAMLNNSLDIRTQGRKKGSLVEHVRSQLSGDDLEIYDRLSEFEDLYIARHDGPDHFRIRQVVHRAFTPRRIAALGVMTQEYLDERLEPLLEQETADFRELAYHVPLMVITSLLGVPLSDAEVIRGWSKKIGRAKESGAAQIEATRAAWAAIGEFKGYVADLLEEHRRAPREEGILAALMGSEQGQLTTDELTAMFVLLLFAGHETTTNLLATGTYELLQRPDQWRILCDEPETIPHAIEELVRFTSPVQFGFRLPVVDVTINGVPVEAGTALCQIYAAANRDPSVFDDPDRLDVRRPNARDHVGFGFGPHYCLGQALARLEGEIFFRTITQRVPDLELATDTFAWTGNSEFRTLTALPVRLGRVRPAR